MMFRDCFFAIVTCCICLGFQVATAAPPDALEAARQVNSLLNQHYADEGITPAPLVSDEDFLRRLSIDLTGRIPTAEQVTLFGLNPDPGKRSQLVDDLVESQEFSQTWATYWRDVIFLRATEQRARLAQPAFDRWMTEQFEKGRSWSQITRDLLTATGPVDENGATGLIFSHTADPQELAAEVSRIFLGIQISCANCHDHPTDSWKREHFHSLAAFLPRVSVRREDPQNPRSFAVASVTASRRPGDRSGENLVDLLRLMDRNRDGKLAKSEIRGPLADRFEQLLAVADKDKDGQLSADELKNARSPMNEQPGRGSTEYYMPDLQDPSSQGTLMQPAFFIKEARGPRLQPGADDLTRRNALADYITSKSNPWFAKAFVNRVWGELTGSAFYMPIDDMGPERQAQLEPVLNLLAKGFAENNYDIRWVYRTITNTKAYQRTLTSDPEASANFAAARATRLRWDQLFNSLDSILGATATTGRFQGRGQGPGPVPPGVDPRQFQFSQLFGYDPSTPQEDLIGNVPQALFLMNSPVLSNALRATGTSRLGRILRAYSNDSDALAEVYLMTLSREPNERELQINLNYIQSIGNREEAYEDILWSLLNSTEFQSKR